MLDFKLAVQNRILVHARMCLRNVVDFDLAIVKADSQYLISCQISGCTVSYYLNKSINVHVCFPYNSDESCIWSQT